MSISTTEGIPNTSDVDIIIRYLRDNRSLLDSLKYSYEGLTDDQANLYEEVSTGVQYKGQVEVVLERRADFFLAQLEQIDPREACKARTWAYASVSPYVRTADGDQPACPHPIREGDTYESVAELYDIPVSSLHTRIVGPYEARLIFAGSIFVELPREFLLEPYSLETEEE